MKNPRTTWRTWHLMGTWLGRCAILITAWIAGCTTPPPVIAPPPEPPPVVEAPKPEPAPPKESLALTAKDYRRDAAAHLYEKNQTRVYPGKLPRQLYAVGVLEVDIDARGNVSDVRWLRAPKHAPKVMADIESSVRSAAPFPLPVKLGKVTYTDTWLWDASGRFQLDTLTEGQM